MQDFSFTIMQICKVSDDGKRLAFEREQQEIILCDNPEWKNYPQ